jgi:hypothetical protein
MPRLSTVATSVDAEHAPPTTTTATTATTEAPPTKDFHRLRTLEEETDGYVIEHQPSCGFDPAPVRDAKTKGFNSDGTVIVPDAPKVPGFDPIAQKFRWPDGSLRPEYPPRNPYVVAARKRWHDLVTHCRISGGDDECAKGKSHRYGIGVLWCEHARYLSDKLNIEPEWNDRGEWYGFDEAKQDPIADESHPIYQELRDNGGKTYEDLVKEADEHFERLFSEKWDEARKRDAQGDAYVPPSRLENLKNPGGQTPFRCDQVGKQSPVEPQILCKGVDELE